MQQHPSRPCCSQPPISPHPTPLWQELGAKFEEVDIPEDMAELAAEYREKLIEQVAELDDDVMMAYLDVSLFIFRRFNLVSQTGTRERQSDPGCLCLGAC